MDCHPNISIIIPTYNKAYFLYETLASVQAQTYTDWECIVVDDGSTDNNLEVAYAFAKNDARFRIYERKLFTLKKGGNSCRNVGIAQSEGKYVIFLDGDDLLVKNCLKDRAAMMENHPHLDFAVFQMGIFSENPADIQGMLTRVHSDYLHAFLSHNIPWPITAPLLKKKTVENVNGFDENFPRLQDPEFYTKILMLPNIKFQVLDSSQPDALYRIPPDRKLNILNGVKGFYLYIKKFSVEIQNRPDRKLCAQALIKCLQTAIRYVATHKQQMKTESPRRNIYCLQYSTSSKIRG